MSGQWEGDNERLCAMERHLQLERFPLPACLKPGFDEKMNMMGSVQRSTLGSGDHISSH